MTLAARARLLGGQALAGIWVLAHPRRLVTEMVGLAESIHAGGRSISTLAGGTPVLRTVMQLDGDMQTFVDPALFARFATAAERANLLRAHHEAIAAGQLMLQQMRKAAALGPHLAVAAFAGSEATLLWRGGLLAALLRLAPRALLLLLPPLVLLALRILAPPLLRRALRSAAFAGSNPARGGSRPRR